MNSFIYHCLFLLFICTKPVYNRSDGAPVGACGTMMPDHGSTPPQPCTTNYRIQSNATEYGTNDMIRVSIDGLSGSNVFRGVLLIAKVEGTDQIIGTWSVTNTNFKPIACGGIANTGVTHSSRVDKTSLEAVWSPPLTLPTANTIIRATIVGGYSTFYVNCYNVTLRSRQIGQSSTSSTGVSSSGTTPGNSVTTATTSTTPTTTAPTTSQVGVDVSWTYANGMTTVTMSVVNLGTSQWLALGLSLDDAMGEDHVFICKRLADNTVAVERRINPGSYSRPVSTSSMSNPGGTFTILSQSLEDGVAYCRFTLSNFEGGSRRRRAISSLSQSTAYHPLIAIGNLDRSNELIKHNSALGLTQKVQLNREESIVYNDDLSGSNRINLMKAHGIIMIFSWILLASTGILIARYFKPCWPENKLCGKALWFAIHRAIMLSAVILTIIAFILILVYKRGKWVSKTRRTAFAHSIIGIIIISFAFIQPIMALFRCKPDGEYRFIFNYAHAIVGSSAFLLSIVALFLAMFLGSLNFRDTTEWGILVGWTCWFFVIYIIFYILDYYFRKQQVNDEPVTSYNLDGTTLKPEPNPPRNQVKQDRIKLICLTVHILIALGLSLALAVRVGQA